MKQKFLFIIASLLLLIIILFTTCQKEKISVREYPRIEISDQVIQNESGVTFSANIITEGNSAILNSGFVWSKNESPTINSPRIFMGKQIGTNEFKGTAQVDLVADSNYFVRAFIQTEDYLVYSGEVNFKCLFGSPPPQIIDFSPRQAKWDDTLTIQGRIFSFLNDNASVFLGEERATTISNNDTVIYALVPPSEKNGSAQLKVAVNNNTGVFEDKFNYITPEINDFSPKSGWFEDTITINGTNFPLNKNYYVVNFIGKLTTNETTYEYNRKANVIENSLTQLKVTVPYGFPASMEIEIHVYISGISKMFNEKFRLVNPHSKYQVLKNHDN